MARSLLNQFARTSYLASRTARDVEAFNRGTLPRRLVRRQVRRNVSGPFADLLWRSVFK